MALPRRSLLAAGFGASAMLIVYGAVQAAGEALAGTGALIPSGSIDWLALRWHLGLWDPWFLVWGMLLTAATWGYRRHLAARCRGGRRGRLLCHPGRGGRFLCEVAQVGEAEQRKGHLDQTSCPWPRLWLLVAAGPGGADRRKDEAELASVAGLALDLDTGAKGLRRPTGDDQAQP